MAQQDKLTYEGTFNHALTGLFKDNTAGEIEAIDHRTQVTNTKDSVPFTLDDSYTWPFPQVTAAGTDTYTATLSPPITAYAAGQKFQILFTNANTGASTLALNGLAALAVTKNGATALVAGDIPVGSIKILAYDGTRLQIIGDGGGAGGSGTVESVTGDGVDNTDPDNPVLTFPTPGDIGAEVAGAAATVATNLSNHISDATDAHAGTAITNTAAGNISATTVQAAINELDAEKQNVLISFRTLTASHTLDSTDLASINGGATLNILMNVAGANDLIIPPNATIAFPVGTVILIDQIGAGATTIVAGSGVTVRNTDGLVLAGQYSGAYAKKLATNEWYAQGKLKL